MDSIELRTSQNTRNTVAVVTTASACLLGGLLYLIFAEEHETFSLEELPGKVSLITLSSITGIGIFATVALTIRIHILSKKTLPPTPPPSPVGPPSPRQAHADLPAEPPHQPDHALNHALAAAALVAPQVDKVDAIIERAATVIDHVLDGEDGRIFGKFLNTGRKVWRSACFARDFFDRTLDLPLSLLPFLRSSPSRTLNQNIGLLKEKLIAYKEALLPQNPIPLFFPPSPAQANDSPDDLFLNALKPETIPEYANLFKDQISPIYEKGAKLLQDKARGTPAAEEWQARINFLQTDQKPVRILKALGEEMADMVPQEDVTPENAFAVFSRPFPAALAEGLGAPTPAAWLGKKLRNLVFGKGGGGLPGAVSVFDIFIAVTSNGRKKLVDKYVNYFVEQTKKELSAFLATENNAPLNPYLQHIKDTLMGHTDDGGEFVPGLLDEIAPILKEIGKELVENFEPRYQLKQANFIKNQVIKPLCDLLEQGPTTAQITGLFTDPNGIFGRAHAALSAQQRP